MHRLGYRQIRVFLFLLLLLTSLGYQNSPINASTAHTPMLQRALAALDEYYWDQNYKGLDWKKLSSEAKTKVEQATSLESAMSEIATLVATLKDHHTRLEPPGVNDMEAQDIYGGIGCVVSLKPSEGYCIISEVFDKSPAHQAGLLMGDRIWAVDLKSVKDFVAEGMHPVNAIRGKIGTDVLLSIERSDGKREDVKVTRQQIIRDKTAESRRLGEKGEIGYLTWDNFFDKVNERVAVKLTEMGDTKGLILDMRSNPGGLIRELVRISSYLGIKDLGKSISREGVTHYRFWWMPTMYEKPLVIIVDDDTASAAEILSTVAQESGRATLVGQPTSNGTAAAITYPIGEGYRLSITTARFYTPKGRPYETSTQPDIVLAKPSEEDIRQGKDPWLDKAVSILQEMLSVSQEAQEGTSSAA